MTARMRHHSAAALLAGMLLSASVAFAAPPTHPLDPLTSEEIAATIQALQGFGFVGSDVFYPLVRLEEPNKTFVRNWNPGLPLHRKAFVQIFVARPPSGFTFEAVVNLQPAQPQVISLQPRPGVQPAILAAEYGIAIDTALSDPIFQAALLRRGYGPSSYSHLFCPPLSAGNYGVPSEAGRRLLRVMCLDTSVENPWAKPIENLTAVVDTLSHQVIDVVDTGVVPMPAADGTYYSVPQAPPAKPITVSAPQGDDLTVNGQQITSPRWNFHFRVEPRDGLVISNVKYLDHGVPRSVFYKGSISETFVPYGDPTSNFYYRTYMDEGEYGLGKSSQPMIPGKDCPENARFFDATLADDWGNPMTIPNAICVFEEKEYLAYHHFDIFMAQPPPANEVARTGRKVVVRYATIVGNYDYYFDWSFRDDGTVDFRVGASGALETKATAIHKQHEDSTGEETKWGTLIDDGLIGANHQHIFNVRLDMDVDGTKNVLAELTPTVVPANYPGSHRTSGWTVVPTVKSNEGAFDPGEHAQVTVFNPHEKNKVGNAVGYAVHSHNETTLLMAANDPPAQRAAYTTHSMWVSPYDQDELYAAGDYPYMSSGSTDGIQHWTAAGRNVADTDLVLWVNVGFSHIPHSENWPMMTTEYFGSFSLEPFNFFDRNPIDNLNDQQ